MQCPKTAAIALVEKKRVPIGWSMVRVELLKKRPIQCHRYWQVGHVRASCKSNKYYNGHCFCCGTAGHVVSDCKNKIRCMTCLGLGLKHNHRMGSARCTGTAVLTPTGKKNNLGETTAASSGTTRDRVIKTITSLTQSETKTPKTLDRKTNSPDRRTDGNEIEMEEI